MWEVLSVRFLCYLFLHVFSVFIAIQPCDLFIFIFNDLVGLPRWLSNKVSACQCRRCGFDPWVGKIPWRRKWQPTPVFSPGKSHGRRSLAGYSPWDHTKSDIIEWLNNNRGHRAIQREWREGKGRWRRNRTGRPLSLLQIHRKTNWTLNKFHKTTSDYASRGHQVPRKATHCLRREVGQNIKENGGWQLGCNLASYNCLKGHPTFRHFKQLTALSSKFRRSGIRKWCSQVVLGRGFRWDCSWDVSLWVLTLTHMLSAGDP